MDDLTTFVLSQLRRESNEVPMFSRPADDIRAKVLVVQRYQEAPLYSETWHALRFAVQAIAAPWSDHPQFDPAWRV